MGTAWFSLVLSGLSINPPRISTPISTLSTLGTVGQLCELRSVRGADGAHGVRVRVRTRDDGRDERAGRAGMSGRRRCHADRILRYSAPQEESERTAVLHPCS